MPRLRNPEVDPWTSKALDSVPTMSAYHPFPCVFAQNFLSAQERSIIVESFYWEERLITERDKK